MNEKTTPNKQVTMSNFDQHIKARLESLEVTPPAEMWNKISLELDRQANTIQIDRNNAVKNNWKYYVAAASIFATLVIGGIYSLQNKPSTPQVANKTVKESYQFINTTKEDVKATDETVVADKQPIQPILATKQRVEMPIKTKENQPENKLIETLIEQQPVAENKVSESKTNSEMNDAQSVNFPIYSLKLLNKEQPVIDRIKVLKNDSSKSNKHKATKSPDFINAKSF